MDNQKTIKQLADELGVEKHIIKYQVKKLSGDYLDNSSGIIFINPEGIKIIKANLGAEKSGENQDKYSNKVDNTDLVQHLLKEVEEKNNQLKDFQKLLENQQKLLDQQQILTLQANKKIAELELKNESDEKIKAENDPTEEKNYDESEQNISSSENEKEKNNSTFFWKKLFRKKR